MITNTQHVYLSRRNLLTLLSKLDRKAQGEDSMCTIIKNDCTNNKYPQSCPIIMVSAIEDEEYYSSRNAGVVHPFDDPDLR